MSMPIPPFRKVTVSTVLPSAPAFRRRWPRCPARRRSMDIAIPVLSVQTTVRATDRAIVSRRARNGGRPADCHYLAVLPSLFEASVTS